MSKESANFVAKKQVVEEIKEKLSKSKSFVVVEYKGITVEEDTKLRKAFREAGADYRVYKNKLVSVACKELGIEGLDSSLEGANAFAFAYNDETLAPRIIKNQNKDLKKLVVKGGIVNNEVIDANKVEALANIPSREQLLAQLLFVLNEPVAKLARALQAVAEQKE